MHVHWQFGDSFRLNLLQYTQRVSIVVIQQLIGAQVILLYSMYQLVCMQRLAVQQLFRVQVINVYSMYVFTHIVVTLLSVIRMPSTYE